MAVRKQDRARSSDPLLAAIEERGFEETSMIRIHGLEKGVLHAA
jgi:hypothetical protein